MSAAGCVTEISVPVSADRNGWRLCSGMSQPEPLPDPEPEPEQTNGDLMTNGNQADAPRWSPEVAAYNDFPAVAQRVAERDAQREAEGAASREAWAALTPAEQEAELARVDAEYEAHYAERAAEAEEEAQLALKDPEAEIG